MEKTSDIELITHLCHGVELYGIDRDSLVEKSEIPLFEKYDTYIPHALLRQAYAQDKLRSDEAEDAIRGIFEEYK